MIKFKKMHGNGNDFIVIENLTKPQPLTKAQIIKMGNRKTGIGFDQLITINPPKKAHHDLYIRFFNSDGSEASMCLNGVRSVGAFVWEERLLPKKAITLGTKSRDIEILPTKSKLVKAIIALPALEEIPKMEKRHLEKYSITNAMCVNAGNYHLLIKVNKKESYDLSSLCAQLRKRIFFKDMNISLFKKALGDLSLRTNEAGAGETLSCGSASAAVASLHLKKNKKLTVNSAGGSISLRIVGDKLEMTGPAECICEGIWTKN